MGGNTITSEVISFSTLWSLLQMVQSEDAYQRGARLDLTFEGQL